MTTNDSDPLNDVAMMRSEFDQLFAAPEPPPPPESDDFLLIRLGDRGFALRVSELAWIEANRKIVALPRSHPSLMGLVSARGQLVPVYNLELMLGLPATPTAKPWVAIHDRMNPIGLAFEALGGYLRVPRQEILGVSTDRQAIHAAGEVRPVVHLPSILGVIRERAIPQPATRET